MNTINFILKKNNEIIYDYKSIKCINNNKVLFIIDNEKYIYQNKIFQKITKEEIITFDFENNNCVIELLNNRSSFCAKILNNELYIDDKKIYIKYMIETEENILNEIIIEMN